MLFLSPSMLRFKGVRCSSAAARPHALDRQMNGLSRILLAVALNHSLRSWITCHANRRNNNPIFSFPLSMRAQFINNPQRKNKRCSMFNECIWDHTAKLSSTTFKTKITPSLHISARMSWSISEILKPFKKTRNRVLSGEPQRRLEFLNLIIYTLLLVIQTLHKARTHSRSSFKTKLAPFSTKTSLYQND